MMNRGLIILNLLMWSANFAAADQQRGADRPLGIPIERWVAITDKAGIALGEQELHGEGLRGDFYINQNGLWIIFYPNLPQGDLMRAPTR